MKTKNFYTVKEIAELLNGRNNCREAIEDFTKRKENEDDEMKRILDEMIKDAEKQLNEVQTLLEYIMNNNTKNDPTLPGLEAVKFNCGAKNGNKKIYVK